MALGVSLAHVKGDLLVVESNGLFCSRSTHPPSIGSTSLMELVGFHSLWEPLEEETLKREEVDIFGPLRLLSGEADAIELVE